MIQLQHNVSALTLLLDDLNDTGMLGQKIASVLSPGMTILLEGELGAGKTTLVREICRALGWKRTCSPSFALVNEYARARIPVAHADLYRIEHADSRDFGLDEYLDDGWILLIEWPDRLDNSDFPDVWRCQIAHGNGESRLISFSAKGEKAVDALKRLENSLK